MLLILMLIGAALAQQEKVIEINPTECLQFDGYIPGAQFGEDCCSFVACDPNTANTTGFLGHCMGGTVWSVETRTCDDSKINLDCDPETCSAPKRTTALCPAGQPTDGTCCVGQDPDNDFPGREPLMESFPGNPNMYIVNGEALGCPEGQEFNLADCCCESELTPVAPCDDVDNNFFLDEANPCCGYLQCWANRTGTFQQLCMYPTVWNDFNKTCDNLQNVDACSSSNCPGTETTDPPCENVADGDCCAAGLNYHKIDGITYNITNPTWENPRPECCPENMMGEQMLFNVEPDECCCEDP